jgi:hypothetical protein
MDDYFTVAFEFEIETEDKENIKIDFSILYDDDVVDGYFSCSWAIKANHACLALAFDDVGFEALTIIDIDNLNALTFDKVGGIHKVFIDGNTADVVEVGLRYAYPMNFGFEDVDEHNL